MNHYHDTAAAGDRLLEFEGKAQNQDDLVLEFFQENRDRAYTPEEVLALVPWHKGRGRPPLTSVRRAMTNLTKAGKLHKLDIQQEGSYGRPCHLWMLFPDPPEQRSLL